MVRSESSRIVWDIARAYPHFIDPPMGLTDEQSRKDHIGGIIDLWAELFADVPSDVVLRAVRMHVATSRFAPTIAEIRARVDTDGKSPLMLWDELTRLMRRGIASVNEERKAYAAMSSECREATIAAGGWYALGMAPEGDPHSRREFMKAAEELHRQRRERTIVAAGLPGSPPVRLLEG